MIRTVLYLLLSIFLLTILRYLIGTMAKGFSDLLRPKRPGQPATPPSLAGELKKDPVCGTYVAVSASVKQTVRGETIHFCSAACRDKYRSLTS